MKPVQRKFAPIFIHFHPPLSTFIQIKEGVDNEADSKEVLNRHPSHLSLTEVAIQPQLNSTGSKREEDMKER